MKIGLTGLKYSGKTSLFMLLTGLKVSMEKSEVNHGMAKVPDSRIDKLSEIFQPKKTTHASLELVDIPGIDPGNPNNRKFFEDIRKMDLLLAVLRDFDSEIFPNPMNSNDFERDLSLMKDEINLQDMAFVEKRIEGLKKQILKQKNKELEFELALMEKCNTALENGTPLSEFELEKEEEALLRIYSTFSKKTLMPIINISESDITKKYPYPSFCLQTEYEISELEEEERNEFYKELGIDEPALNKIVRSVYEQAGLISFFTVGKDEVRAWTIKKGLTAKEAAGKIHSDLEKGFIRAETVSYDDFIEYGDMAKAKAENKVRLEGKDYIVKDGDILNIRFNV